MSEKLSHTGYFRGWLRETQRCYEILCKNAEIYIVEGNSHEGSNGSEVCGKCVTGSPWAFWNR